MKPITASGIPVHCAHARLADVTTLVANPRNPNKHGDAQVALLAKIIRHQGWRAPITISKRSGFIVTGHGRLAAALLLQVEKVPVDEQDFATEADEWAHLAADNRIAELAETDGAMLKDLLGDLDTGAFDMDLTGFDSAELERVINSYGDHDDAADAEPQIDKAAELNKAWQVKPGDLWRVGEHRLLCGDSTKAEDVGRVMGGEKASFVFTDPPYGVAYSGRGKSTSQQTIENDDLDPKELQVFLTAAFEAIPAADGCNIFICHADQKIGIRPAFEAAFIAAGFRMGGTCIWVKNVASMGWQDFRAAHEPILFGWTEGGNRIRVEDRALTTVWPVGREGNYLHPTTKPAALVAYALNACSSKGMICWDSFLGSGTTMVACENLGRKCRGIEISPDYCAVILQRMKDSFPAIEIELLAPK